MIDPGHGPPRVLEDAVAQERWDDVPRITAAPENLDEVLEMEGGGFAGANWALLLHFLALLPAERRIEL